MEDTDGLLSYELGCCKENKMNVLDFCIFLFSVTFDVRVQSLLFETFSNLNTIFSPAMDRWERL